MLYGENANEEILIADYKDGYEIKRIYMKPYAACRHSHPSIEAVVDTLKENKINYGEVKTIQIRTYKAAIEGHDHKDIQGSNSAKMSIPYSVVSSCSRKSRLK